MLKIGLTGGVGSGKSTVAKYFAKLNIPIIDADKIARDLFFNNATVHKKIFSHFKTLNRKKISEIIFHDKKERLWLEQLMHPRICKEMIKLTKLHKAPYCIMEIPLLLETKFPPKVDRILVVDCPKKTQISRASRLIIANQIGRGQRLKQVDDIICNTGTMTDLKKMVKKLHNYYLGLLL